MNGCIGGRRAGRASCGRLLLSLTSERAARDSSLVGAGGNFMVVQAIKLMNGGKMSLCMVEVAKCRVI